MEYGNSLSSLLKHYGPPRATLALLMDVSLQTIHNWCAGRVPVPVHHLTRLSECLASAGVGNEQIAELVQSQLIAHGLDQQILNSLAGVHTRSDASSPVMLMAWDAKSGGLFPYFTNACREAIGSLGYNCLVMDCGGDHQMRHTYVREAVRQRYKGVILAGVPGAYPSPHTELLEAIQPLVDAGIPVVMLAPWNGHVTLPTGVTAVGWDADASNWMAIETLLAAGHEDITFVLSETGPLMSGLYQGLDRTFAERGLPFKVENVVWLDGDPDDMAEVQRAIRGSTAIFARPSTLTTVTNACYSERLRWPDDVSVLTLGHPQSSTMIGGNPFTYVGLPLGKVSRAAAHLLASMLEEGEGPYSQQFIVYGRSSMRVMNLEGGSVGPPALAGRR